MKAEVTQRQVCLFSSVIRHVACAEYITLLISPFLLIVPEYYAYSKLKDVHAGCVTKILLA